jgi:hypothetical protein
MTDLTDVGYRLSKRDINRAITALMNQLAEIVCEKYEEWMANGQSEKWEMLNERSHNLQTSIENFQSAVSEYE